MFGNNKVEVENLKTGHKLATAKLKEENKRLKETLEDLKDFKTTSDREHNRVVSKKNARIDELDQEVKVLADNAHTFTDNLKFEAELATRETVLEAKETQFDTFQEELKKANDDSVVRAEKEYKTGYSDGLADGIRKVHEITAEDRKQAMQVAALAASSHTPAAAEKVADGIRSDMLGLGTGEKKAAKK